MNDPRSNRPQKLAHWRQMISNWTFTVMRDRGALWTGMTPAQARIIGQSRKLTVLEATPIGGSLDHGELRQMLLADFGDTYPPEVRAIFTEASEKFAAALSGCVHILLPENMSAPPRGTEGSFRFYSKIVWREIMRTDFGSPLVSNARVTGLRLLSVRGTQVCGEWDMPSSPYLH